MGVGQQDVGLRLLRGDRPCVGVACDVSEPSFEVARKYWAEAGVEHLIEERLGDAKATLDDVIATGGADSFDIGGGGTIHTTLAQHRIHVAFTRLSVSYPSHRQLKT